MYLVPQNFGLATPLFMTFLLLSQIPHVKIFHMLQGNPIEFGRYVHHAEVALIEYHCKKHDVVYYIKQFRYVAAVLR